MIEPFKVAFDPGCWCVGLGFDRTSLYASERRYVQHVTIYLGPLMILIRWEGCRPRKD